MTCLEAGERVLSSTALLVAAYWCGVTLVLVHRANRLAAGDHRHFGWACCRYCWSAFPLTISTGRWRIG